MSVSLSFLYKQAAFVLTCEPLKCVGQRGISYCNRGGKGDLGRVQSWHTIKKQITVGAEPSVLGDQATMVLWLILGVTASSGGYRKGWRAAAVKHVME